MFFCENSSRSLRGIVPRIERPSCHSVKRHCAFILVLQFILYASLNSFTRDYCLLLRLHNASRRLLCLQTAKLILLRPRFPRSPLCWSCYPVRTLIAICYVVSTLLCCLRNRRHRSCRVYISLTVP